eukprot:superscaffoldBa00000892_g7860
MVLNSDVATPTHQQSVTTEERNQKEKPVQVPKDVKEEQENTAQFKVADTKSDGKTNTHLTKRQEQQPGNSNVDVSRSLTPSSPPSQSDAEGGQLVAADILKKAIEPQTPQMSLGDKRYLVEQRHLIPKNIIHESIPYKYAVLKNRGKHYEVKYETIYQKEGNLLINRSLIGIMKDHAYLVDIDHFLAHSWMSLLSLDDLMSFMSRVPVELLDILLHLHFSVRSGITHSDYRSRERIHEESIGETLETMREWRRTTFKNKLLNEWNRTQFSVPHEIEVWNKLLSLSFSHEQHTSFWRTTFTEDFEGKLKQEHPVNQIGIYSNKMEELSKTSPVLCRSMEKCALEAIAAICQDKSGRNVSALLERHDITKFGKLMSVVVLKSWPTDAKGDYIEGEDLIFENLLNWPMAKTVFQMAGARKGLIDKLSDEAQIRMTLASSAFKSVSEKFLSGEIQMKTLDQILQREREFVDLLKIDGLCDDGRCKDDRNMRRLLRLRNEEAEAVHNEKELVRSLLQICQELPQHVKELHAIKDSSIFKVCWMNRVEELSRDQPDTDDTEHLDGNEEIYTLDLIYSKIFQSCYSKYKGLYDGLKSGELLLEEIDSLFEDYKGNYEDLRKDLQIMCRTNPSDNRRWITERINQIQQYQDLHLAMDTAKIIMDIRNTICPEGDFKVLEKLLQMNQADFKKNSLNCIDDTFINAKHILKDITDNRRECLQQLSLTSEFVQWVKKALEDINELKVFVDLASISAGENDLDVDRVACFHDAVLGYSSILYGLKEDSDFKAFNESLSKLWKALENDRNIPKKLRDTARHLEWLKTVKESHGSVEFSSLSLATSINERGIYIIKAQNQKKVQKGLNEFLFKLLFLRYLMDSDGWMWRCSHKHLYIIELLESTNDQPRYAPRSGRKENFAFLEVFPKVICRPPKEVMALEMRREEITDMESDDPLMDDKCFRSEAYQRPYQYLTRFYNNDNLDNFTYQGIEGTHAKCLQILLIYCGILDPSWAELRNFVWFLNLQLQDCENSVFCKFEFVGDTLRGFKNFVVEFMILMSKDFATPSLCITDQSLGRQQIDTSGLNERDLAPFLIRKRWESEPHPYIFFNDDHMSMTFIGFHLEPNDQNGVDAINPLTGNVIKRNIMTQELYTGLKLQRVPFNRDFDQLPRADKIEHLCSVLGIKWPTDPDETYELTTDNILKMMAIHMRFRCGIPVIIMGETGCGKTRLIKFMCELRRCGAPAENMKLVKVHGGTTSEMIYEKVAEAETLARTNTENHEFDSVLFFDEANTTEAISSIKEILCDNSVQGQQLGCQTGLQIIAACNPYRKHTEKMIERLEASGLGYRVRAEETEDRLGSIPLRQLVYRVHALPPSMIPLVWDFGQLNDSTEQMYIEQIVQRQARANLIENRYIPTITKVLSSSQKFMRERKDECSFVSLRDVERCMHVFVWFHKNHSMFAEELRTFLQRKKNKPSFSPASDRVIWSLLMATGVCYQSCLEDKRPYQRTISLLLSHEYDVQRVQEEIQLMHDLLLNGVPMGKTIARNDALKENFFMMVICVELRIPLFIVGKPGSSKSLSKTLVADAMQGPASHSELYKRLKQIHLVSFQCSPHSTPEGIINTFKQCSRFQESKNLDEYISVVVLDEIGLAEDSPKMPLKTLHPLLEEGCVDDEPLPYKRVGFIGISNWALDPAKMNRGIFVSRGDPNQKELIKSAKGICSSEEKVLEKIKHLFPPFAKAYMTVCKEGKGFFGLRDFYSLIKMVFSITKVFNKCPTADQITGAVLRNFSGKDDVDVMTIFSTELRDEFAHANISTIDLVEQSISPALQVEQSAIDLAKQNISPFCQEQESRYLLILTKNYAALQILQQIFFSHQIHPEIIFGSSFPKDQEYTQICRNINRVKVCMETGQTVVLLNLQNLYESLYDALNQYYVTLGGQKYVDLGLGTHRVKCRVHKNFRLIVIEEKEVVYEQFPIPLINRLEKHYLDINTVLRDEQKGIARQLQKWVDDFISLSSQHSTEKQYTPSDVFIGYHSDTCSSVVLQITENQSVETEAQTILKKAKDILLNCATPDSVVRLDKSRLPDEEVEQLMKEYIREEMHSSLGDYIVYHTQQAKQSNFFTEVTTFSRLLTATDTQQLQSMVKLDDIKLLSLYQFDTEYSFLKKIREFLGSAAADKVLIIQTDYDEDSHRGNILSSAKYSCINEINKWATTDNTKTFVYFVTKLPRMEGGTSYVGFQGGVFVNIVRKRLHSLLEEYEAKIHNPKNWVLREASNVNALQEGGTFLHTLWRKIQAVVTPLLANLVSVIDRDCNLDLLLDSGEDIRNLWLEIFASKEVLNVPYVRVENSTVLMVQSHIIGGSTMRCVMPFSWWIKDFLDRLMMQTSRHEKHLHGGFHELFLNTPLGSYMVKNVNEKMKKEFFERYLQDFVSMTMKVASNEELQLLRQALASCVDEVSRRKRDEDQLSLPHIHIAYHFYQSRLQNLSRMISLRPEIVSPLQRNLQIRHCPEMVLDVHAAMACVESLDCPTLDTDALCQQWLKEVKRLQASLELICSQQLQLRYKERLHDVRASIKKNAEFRQHCNGFFIDLLSTVCFKDNRPPAKGVITHLLSYLMVETEHEQIHTKDLSPFDESPDKNPVVRSVILKLLLKFSFEEVKEYLQQHLSSVEDSKFVDEGDKAELYALYINCLEDSMWEKMPQEGNKAEVLRPCYDDETQFLNFFLAEVASVPPTVSIQHLQHIAQLRLSLTMAAQLISDNLSENNVPDRAEDFVNMVIKLCEESGNDWFRVYLIRKLSEWRGVELVQTLVKQPKFSWLFPAEVHQQNEDGGQMDEYLVYGDEYKAVRDAVAKAVVDGDVEQIEEACEKCTAPPRNRTMFILLALFREVTTLYRSVNTGLHPTPERCQAFGDLIQGSRFLHQREVRDFASALVHNRLGALAIHPGHTIVDNTVIELTVHLAAVLLTGTHPLLRPLQQLGLSPENMQCGMPMQKGKCLECGHEIGGEHHAALPEFRPIQLQHDRTRPGHILGDPERRSDPDTLDTKNMSLTPFTLVRLVTHLAMLLGASEKAQFVQQIIQPPVEDVCSFLTLHIIKDLDQLSQALGRGADDTVTTVHLVLRSLLEPVQTDHTNPHLTTKASRNTWETTVAAEIMTPQVKDLDQSLQEAQGSIRTDSRVSSNFIMRTTFGDDCTFLTSLPQDSQVHSSAVWSCRERLSLLSLTHIVEYNDQKEELPLLWKFLQKEREFRQIKLLPDILILQKRLVRKFQNASDQIVGSIGEFIEKQTDEMKIPDEFCSEDLDLNSDLQYLLPRRQGPGLCATGLVSYLVALHNELVNTVDSHTGEDSSSSYRVSVAELTEQHVISYEVEKDLLPLVLSNCQYSLEHGHETISQYDLPRIQQQILTRFLQGKPLINRTEALSSLIRTGLSRELDSYSEVCEALKIVELLLGFLTMTGGDPKYPLVAYLQDMLKMADHIDRHILQALGRCTLRHCISLWQLLSSLKSENMLRLKREPFSGYPAEYQKPLTEEDKNQLKGFVSRGNVDQWLLEMHEFILLNLGRPQSIGFYQPLWSVKDTLVAYMDRKEEEVPAYLEDKFPENLLLSQIVETWKCSVIAKQDWMMNG